MAQWTVQNKRVPKAYINFVSRDDVIIPLEDNTIAAVMIAGSWGEPGVFHTLLMGNKATSADFLVNRLMNYFRFVRP